MKTNLSSFVAGAALALSAITFAAPASIAASQEAAQIGGRCVDQSEFRRARRGMTKAQVARLFDTAGKRDAISSGGGFKFEIRSYKACSRFGAVSIAYNNGRLSNKTAIF
jgi:hypothetical protein